MNGSTNNHAQRNRWLDLEPFQIERRRLPPRGLAVVPVDGSRTNTTHSSEPEDATVAVAVKWFKDDKGYGFVEIGQGKGDAFLHASTLHAAGVGTVSAGARLRVVVREGVKGPQVARVVEVEEPGIVERPRRSSADRAPLARRTQPNPQTSFSMGGIVKWFNDAKGFGFVLADDGGKDVFVHVSTLDAAGVARLADGQPVTMQVVDTPRGREAVTIAIRAYGRTSLETSIDERRNGSRALG